MPPSRFPASIETETGTPGLSSPNGFLESWDETAELRWPNSTLVYDRMRRTDGQTASVLRAIGLPIRRTIWRPRGSDVDPRVRALVEAEFGLQLDDRGRRRRLREGISWDEHIRHALLSLPIGHMPFNQVYSIGPPPPGIDGLPPVIAHLRKLSPRMPRTITGFEVAADGGLDAIRQWAPDPRTGFATEVRIPISDLVMYVNEREGADWAGTSILRAAYKHWLIKDQLLRLSAMAGERNSMGLPVVGFDESGSKREALRIASTARAGEQAGIALPLGYTFTLEGVSGTVKDLLPDIKYHDESIGRSALAMFLNLGHDRGSQSLGDTFVDFFTMSLEAVIADLEESVTEYAVRDFVALNFGPDEPYPVIAADDLEPNGALTAEGLAVLAHNGVIIPDVDLEAVVRRRAGLPAPMRADTAGPGAPSTEVPAPGDVAPPQPVPDAPAPPTAAAARRSSQELSARLELITAELARRRAARRAHDHAA